MQPFETLFFLYRISPKKSNQKGGETHMQGTVEVTDLYKGAFLLCMGGRLEQVNVRNNGRKIATFLITGKDIERLDDDYRCGRAQVNPVQFRETINHLRDLMFKKLRNQTGRTKYDHRPKRYRPSQAL